MLAEFLLHSLEKRAAPAVRFIPEHCLRRRLSGHGCEICLSLCRAKALSESDGKILFVAEKCTGCMACVSGCPNDAFGGGPDILSLPRLLREAERQGPAVLSCGRAAGRANRIAIPCLGLLAAPVLAALHCLASRDLYLDTGPCGDCPNGHVVDLLEERLQAIKDKWGRAFSFGLRYFDAAVDDRDPGRQRRFFLSRAKDSLVGFGREVSTVIEPTGNPGEEEAKDGKEANKISRLLRRTLELLPPEADRKRDLLRSYFYSLTVDANCDRCPACTGMCPTGALQRRTGEAGKQLVFTSAACSGCGLCVAFCRKKALTLRQGGGGRGTNDEGRRTKDEETELTIANDGP